MMNREWKSWKLSLVGLLAVSSLVGCGSPKEASSESKVTNGIQVKNTDFPSVVLLVKLDAAGESICTGTFVNDSQVVTAGHCVEGLNAARPFLFFVKSEDESSGRPIQALSFVRHQNYDITAGVGPLDLSVINFPANSAPAVTPIISASPTAGEEFTIVGYGNNENFFDETGFPTGSGAGIKRSGTNKIADVADGMIAFVGVPGSIEGLEEGQIVSSGSGDSGGPLFVNGQLAGITSGGGFAPIDDGQGNSGLAAVSFYVDLNSQDSLNLLASVLKK